MAQSRDYRRHPKKGKTWVNNKYWHSRNLSNWNFSCKVGDSLFSLPKHQDTKITQYIKVKGNASPYDNNQLYWASKMGKHPQMKASVARLLKTQMGRCNQCNLIFKPEDKIESDRIVPLQAGGHKYKDNLRLLHKHCHDVKTKTDLETIRRYKYRKVWNRHYKQIQRQFEKLQWFWENDIPTLSLNGMHNKHLIREERSEAKVSCCVLKTSRPSDWVA